MEAQYFKKFLKILPSNYFLIISVFLFVQGEWGLGMKNLIV